MDWSSYRDPQQPHVRWAAVRSAQCIDTPVLLVASGLTGGFAFGVLGSAGRDERVRERMAAPPGHAERVGPHPGVPTLILWLVLLVINFRI